MFITRGIPIAVTESDALVWASEASAYTEYFCARCAAAMQLDCNSYTFVHPPSSFCSLPLSQNKSAILYLERMLWRSDARLQLLRRCSKCATLTLSNIRGEPSRVMADDGTEGLLVSGAVRMIFWMRPSSTVCRRFALRAGLLWLDVDSRNVIDGGPIAVLDSNFPPLLCFTCRRSASKMLNNP
jgi:hypothetical protein